MEEVKDYITEEEHDRVEVMMRLCRVLYKEEGNR